MATSKEYRKTLKLEIHSLLCTEKQPISARKLHYNYRNVMGTNILWVKSGHRTLEDLLKSMTDILTYTFENSQMMVKAKPKDESSHITEMVAEQKIAKIKNKNKDESTQSSNVQHQNGPVPTSNITRQSQGNWNERTVQPTHVSQQNHPHWQRTQSDNRQFTQGNEQVAELPRHTEANHQSQLPTHTEHSQQAEAVRQPSRQMPGVNLELLRQLIKKKQSTSQSTCTEPVMQSNKQTQTPESSPVKSNENKLSEDELVAQMPKLVVADSSAECLPREYEARQVHSRASTEPSVTLPTLPSSAATSPGVTRESLTCVSRLGNTTFVRVIPSDPPSLNRSLSSNRSTENAPVRQRAPVEGDTSLERLVNMSKMGLIGSISHKHHRVANGRFRAFVSFNDMEFSSLPYDCVHYTDAYEKAAENALRHIENTQDSARRG